MPNPFRKKNKSVLKDPILNSMEINRPSIAPTPNQTHHDDFPGVEPNGVLGSRRLGESHTEFSARQPKDSQGGIVPVVVVERVTETSQRTTYQSRRRASVEQRMRKDPYHASLIDGRAVFPSEGDGLEIPEPQAPVVVPSIQALSVAEASTDTDTSCPKPPKLNNLIVGRQDPNSRYFTRRHAVIPNSRFLQSVRDTAPFCGLHWCSDVDPAAYELYNIWLHSDTLSSRCHDFRFESGEVDTAFAWAACWPLMNAAIMGYSMKEVDFTDHVMDTLNEKVPRYVWPDIHTLQHLFGEQTTNVPNVLKNFVVDRCVECGAGALENLCIENQPGNFLLHLNDAIKHLERHSLDPVCEYHTHATPESCYKRRMTPKSVRKNNRYKHHRQFSHIDAMQVATDSQANNIHIVDWAEREDMLTGSLATD